MDLKLALQGNLTRILEAERKAMEAAHRRAMERAAQGLKASLRQQVEAAGLGRRVANAWRSKVYPAGGKPTLSPAGLVYSNAPKIVEAFDEGAVIRSPDGHWLAIPTKNVPRARGGRGARRKMTPEEVEIEFNADLHFLPSRRRGVAVLAIPAVRAKSKKGFRKASSGRVAQGRRIRWVPMFVVIKQSKLPKKLDVARAVAEWNDRLPGLLADELASLPARVERT